MKKFLNILLAIVLSAGYCIFLVYNVCKQPMNSDSATMLLYAEDILSGNIFLSGWSLTGLTFLATDLPFFVIGVAIAGVSLNAFRIAVTLMYLFMAGSALALSLYGIKNKWTAVAIMAAVGLFPTTYALSNAFVHTAVFALIFLAVLCAEIHSRTNSKAALIMLGVITALAVCSDGISLVMITASVILLVIFGAFRKNAAISVAAGTAVGFLLERLYLLIGGADLNNLQQSAFIGLDKLWYNIGVYIEYFLKLINAYFFTKDIFSVKTLFFALKILIAFFAVYIIYRAIKDVFTKNNPDLTTSFLGTGFALMTAILCITTINTGMTAGRYIGFLPAMLGIVIIRFLDRYDILENRNVLIIPFSLIIAATSFVPSGTGVSPYNTYSELAEFLQENNLTYGYTSFWDASVINGYTENEVKVRPVEFTDGKIVPRVWFCKLEWYEKPAQFFIVRNDGSFEEEDNYKYNGIYHMRLNATAMFGINRENVINSFGEPEEIKDFKNYSVLIYDNIYLNQGE